MTDHSDKLGTYKGYPVIDTKIVVKGIGDGLSNPVAIEPTVVEPGKTAFLAVRVATSKHRYEFASDDEGHIIGVTLVQEFICTGAALADEKLIGAAIQKNVDHIKEEEARKKGQLTLTIESTISDINDKPKRGRKAVQ